MNLQTHYYFLLLRRAYQDVENYVHLPISMTTIAQTLFCTERNVKLILNKLIEEGLIEFTSGRGRGNTSTITFLESLNSSLLKQIKILIKENEVNKALDLVKEFGKSTEVEEYVINWITNYFGYKKIPYSENELEILRFPIYRPITTVDPCQVFFDFDAHLVKQVYNTLVDYHKDTREFTGSLAHSWENNEDCTEWVFFLRKAVQFHNGKELTANVVKNSIERLRHSPHKWLMDDILEIKVLSKYAISFSLNKANHLFLHYLAYTPMSIIDTAYSHEGFFEFPFGTGPFQFEKIEPASCVIQANPNYFGYRPHLDKIEIIQIPEELKDSIEGLNKIFLDTGETKRDEKEKWDTTSVSFSGTNVITFNTVKDGPLKNVKIRKILGQLFDRKKLAGLGKPRLQPADGFLIDQEQAEFVTTPNPPLSVIKEKLKSLGYFGEKITLYTYTRHSLDGKVIQRMLAEAGVRLELKIVGWNKIQCSDVLSSADMIMFEGTPNEGFISLFELLLFEKGFIFPLLTEPLRNKMLDLIGQIRGEVNSKQRLKLYRDLEKFLVDNGIITFLVHKQVEVSYDDSLEGVHFNSRKWIDFKDLWYKHFRISSN